MKWSHLPEAGGLYDQHPDLLDGFKYIFAKRAEHDSKEREKQERDTKRKNPGTRGRRG